ncbi:MAG: tRNA (adenosine(37)-N6)-threonylcarbamoyltransferase complex dimerization subunit type 1 TsaB [Treponema sp.]|nr:tRNA (adenosine(37)-N6)-threonylcarbamoyltransferase complex dimerization subunit type 1 TsaB [Treponema sp.]
MKIILALDTATPILSAALIAGERHWYREADAGLGHSELLLTLADGLLKDAGLGPGDLEAVACMKGPGSFTGLRIGFSAAKGIALARGIPLIGCPTLDCLAYSWSPWPALVLPVLDAKKNRFFTALYDGEKRITEEMDADLQTITGLLQSAGSVLLTGPDAPLFLSRLKEEGPLGKPILDRLRLDPLCRRGRGMELAVIAKKRRIMNNEENDILSAPEYLRESGADISS